MKKTLGSSKKKDCDLFSWNFKIWEFNSKVRQTQRNLRLNPKPVLEVFPKDSVKKLVKDLQFERGYYWEEIKNSQDYKKFKSFLIVRWVKLLIAALTTFAAVYYLVYQFDIGESKKSQKAVKSDIEFKLGLYACFIPFIVYAWCLFGKTEKLFVRIFRQLIEARKSSLGQVINCYNREVFKPGGLVVFFDDLGFNLILGKI